MKGLVAVGEDRKNIAEARACKTLDNTSELWPVAERLNRTIGGERAHMARLFEAELVRFRSVIAAAFRENEGKVRNEMCDMPYDFPAKASSDAPGPSVVVLSDQS